jgi:mRNA interferase MazF
LNPLRESEQAGNQTVVRISGNIMNTYTPNLIACPLTTKGKKYKGNVIVIPTKENGLKQVSENFDLSGPIILYRTIDKKIRKDKEAGTRAD